MTEKPMTPPIFFLRNVSLRRGLLLTALAGLLLFARPVSAAPKGQLVGLTSGQDGAKTSIRIQGSKTPTFTVYKLENPSRVVVDVVGARLAPNLTHEGKAVWNIHSWAVGQVSAHNMAHARGDLVRFVVGLSRPSSYQVRSEDKTVVVEVVAKTKPPALDAGAMEKAQKESAEVRRAAQLELETARAEAAQIRSEAERNNREAQEKIAQAERLVKEAQVRRQEAQKQALAAKKLQSLALEQKAQAQKAQAQADQRQASLAQAQAAADKARQELQRARANKGTAAAKLTAKAEAAVREAEARRKAATEAQRLAEVGRREAQEALQKAAEQRALAAQLVLAAKKEKEQAQAARDRSVQVQELALKERKTAEDAATQALARATELKRHILDEESRFAAAKRLRTQEEAAVAKAKDAVAKAEEQSQFLAEANKRVATELAELVKAKSQAEAQRKSAQVAADEARAAANDNRIGAKERERLQREATRLATRQRAAENELREQELVVSKERKKASLAKAESARVAKQLASLEKAAASLQEKRKKEEERLSVLIARRGEMQEALKEARTIRAQAVAELENARATRLAADKERAKATADALAAKSERAKAAADALAARSARTQAQAEVLAAKGARTEAHARQLAAERERAQAAADALAAKGARSKARADALAAQRARETAKKDAELARAALAKANADAQAAQATKEAAKKRAQAAELQIQKELDRAKRARLMAEKNRRDSEKKIAQAAKQERLAQSELRATQRARALAEAKGQKAAHDPDADAAAIAQAKSHEEAAQAALRDARAERLAAQKAREMGEAALQRAKEREAAAAETLAKASKGAALHKKVAPLKTRLQEVDVVQRQDAARLVIALSSPAVPRIIKNRDNEAVLEIPSTAMKKHQERTLDTSSLRGPIRAVSSYRDPSNPDTVKIVVDLNEPVEGSLKKVGNTYYWDFPTPLGVATSSSAKRTDKKREAAKKGRMMLVPPQAVAGYGASSAPITQQTVSQLASGTRKKTYRGKQIDLDYKNADIHNLMRLLADVGGVNIVVPDDIRAKVTIRLRGVPWDQALDVILASKGLGFKLEGPRLYRVATRDELDAEFEAKLARAKAKAESEPPSPEVFNLNYVVAEDVQDQLESLLSPKGRLEVDTRSNALIINDVVANRRRIIDLLTRLDTQTPQIQIESRIVEARSTFVRQFGIQWGGNVNLSPAGGNATGLLFPSSVGIAGASDDGQTPSGGVSAAPSDFAVNLPAAIGTGSGGGIGMSLGSVGGNFNLNLRLSALEDEGSVRIISAPKITTSNNIEAEIKSGVSIPISVISANGAQTQFVPAELSLKVRPTVSLRDCAVSMEIEVKKNEADFVNTGARGDPTLLTKEAKTTMLVQDGDTSVIGGIYTRNSGVAYSKVPFLGDIPVLGWLFKSRRENDERTEVLVFITPKITNRSFLPCK